MNEKELPKLNTNYIYLHRFMRPKFPNFVAGINNNGEPWVGRTSNPEECNKMTEKSKNSTWQYQCRDNYLQLIVYRQKKQ